jgi:hypothetical protein
MGERLPHVPRRRTGIVLLLAAVGLAAAGGIAYATIPDGSGVFHACVNAHNGNVRIIDPGASGKAGHCKGNEQAVSWNQTGPPGTPGAPGAPGAPGLSGLQTVSITSISNSFSPKEAVVPCPAGKRVIGGGGAITGGSVADGSDLAATVALKTTRPITVSGVDGWTARAEEIAPGFDGNWSLSIYAICANVAA